MPVDPGYPADPVVHVECLGLGGLSLMEHLVGYDRAILVDTILTGEHPIGTVSYFSLDELPDLAAGHLTPATTRHCKCSESSAREWEQNFRK